MLFIILHDTIIQKKIGVGKVLEKIKPVILWNIMTI